VLAFASITCPLLVWLLSRQDAHWSQLPVSLERQALAGNCSWWGEFHRAPLISLAVVGLFGWAFRWARWIEAAWAGLLGGAGAGLVAMVAKVIFGRPRPAVHLLDGFYWFKLGSSWASFPSGHAAHCFGMAVGASLVLPRLWPVSLAGAFLVAWSRFALHRHYPSDLLAGATVGIVMGMLFGLAARRRLAAAAELTEWTNRS
jgi:undecaprenyl-diphosphatase